MTTTFWLKYYYWKGDSLVPGQVIKQNHDENGNPIGKSNINTLLDTKVYKVQFPDGTEQEYMKIQRWKLSLDHWIGILALILQDIIYLTACSEEKNHWYLSADDYVAASIKSIEHELAKSDKRLSMKIDIPMSPWYHTELDIAGFWSCSSYDVHGNVLFWIFHRLISVMICMDEHYFYFLWDLSMGHLDSKVIWGIKLRGLKENPHMDWQEVMVRSCTPRFQVCYYKISHNLGYLIFIVYSLLVSPCVVNV
jgi:hypothetical protein